MKAKSTEVWPLDRLKDISAINLDSLPAYTAEDFSFRYLEISNVNSFGVVSEDAIERLQFADAPSRARRLVNDGDVLVSSVRPNLQAIAHFGRIDEKPLVCSTGFNVISPRMEKVADCFLYYFVLSEGTRQHFESVAKGVGYPALDDKDFNATPVPLPPLAEQKRIAAYLDASCAAIDRAVETKRKQLETLGALRKSIIQKAVTQGLNPKVKMKDHGVPMYGKAPANWRKSKLRYEIQIANGKFASDKIVDDGEFPIYGGNGVMARSNEWNTEPPFIVIGRVGALCGNAHYVDVKAWVSDNAMLVTTNHYPQFLTELFTALDFNS